MQSITRTYLTDIIFRAINTTIHTRRASQKNHIFYLNYPNATEDEMVDFVLSIPYFDERLKDFLMGNLNSETTIISQAWETAFIVKCTTWAASNDWLHVDSILSIGFYAACFKRFKDCLTLPY